MTNRNSEFGELEDGPKPVRFLIDHEKSDEETYEKIMAMAVGQDTEHADDWVKTQDHPGRSTHGH